jgi:hypothetical protein
VEIRWKPEGWLGNLLGLKPGPNLYIEQEIANHRFTIAGGQPGMKASWQVTVVRHDAYAKAHPLEVSVDKPEAERGYYMHPDLYGAPAEKSLTSAHIARVMKRAQAGRVQPGQGK